MTTLIAIYLAFGFFSYWPMIIARIEADELLNGKWYEFLAAHAIWTLCWPYRYILDAWYWWRAKK